MVNVDLDAAFKRLDTDIALAESAVSAARKRVADAEERLNDLVLKRRGAQAFIDYVTKSQPATESASSAQTYRTAPNGLATVVEQIVRRNPDRVLSIADVQQMAVDEGHVFDGEQVRNALSYMGRKGIVSKGPNRGTWALVVSERATNDFGPAILAGPKEASETESPSQGTVITGTFGSPHNQ